MKNKFTYLIILTLIAWAVVLGVLYYKLENPKSKIEYSLSKVEKVELEGNLKESINQGTTWFAKVQKQEGDFRYQLDTKTAEVSTDNNIVRQAGSLYSLAQAYRYTKDAKTLETLEKGFAYFETLMVELDHEKSAIKYEGAIKSNTTALLLLALVEHAEATDSKNFDLIYKLTNYLVYTQTTNGDFVNEFLVTPEISDYNNGETFYAIIRSYLLTKNANYLASAKKAADNFAQTYLKEDFNSSFFSWGMAGFAYLYEAGERQSSWDFLRKYYSKYLLRRGNTAKDCARREVSGCVSPGFAVFLEGVNHIGWVASKEDTDMYVLIKDHVEVILRFLLRYQIGSKNSTFSFEHDLLQGAVCADSDCGYTRIDFTQHQLSANYLYLRFFRLNF